MTASRNDPCPCGSGAKYKRCCLAKDEAAARKKADEERARLPAAPEPTDEDLALEDELDRDPTLAAAVDRPFDEDEAPWELACFAESHPTFAKARARDREWAATPALPCEVERLTDGELRARVEALGGRGGPELFRAAARAAFERGEPSGWALAREWRAGRSLSRPQRDFLGLAACELWRRFFAEEPSREMLEDTIEEGHVLLAEKRPAEAFEVWKEALEVVLERVRPGSKTFADSPACGDAKLLGEWVEDWLDALHSLAHDDPDSALAGLTLADTLIAKVPEQSGAAGGSTRAARSYFLLALGRDEEGLAEARRLRDEQPDLAVGHIALAEALAFDADRDPGRLAEAVSVLSTAQTRGLRDAKEWELDRRRDELLRRLRRARAGT